MQNPRKACSYTNKDVTSKLISRDLKLKLYSVSYSAPKYVGPYLFYL